MVKLYRWGCPRNMELGAPRLSLGLPVWYMALAGVVYGACGPRLLLDSPVLGPKLLTSLIHTMHKGMEHCFIFSHINILLMKDYRVQLPIHCYLRTDQRQPVQGKSKLSHTACECGPPSEVRGKLLLVANKGTNLYQMWCGVWRRTCVHWKADKTKHFIDSYYVGADEFVITDSGYSWIHSLRVKDTAF